MPRTGSSQGPSYRASMNRTRSAHPTSFAKARNRCSSGPPPATTYSTGPAALYVACDVFVMPSRALNQRDGVEGFGIVFLEAGACAKPVVGGRSGGIADAVLDGVTGVLVNPTDIAELEGALIRLLRDPAEAQRLGMQGRKRAEALAQSWEPTVRRIFGTPPQAPDGHR